MKDVDEGREEPADPGIADTVADRRRESQIHGGLGRRSRHLPARRREESVAALQNRRERRRTAGRFTLTMTSCRHHSGYLADDEAGHTTYVARVSVSGKTLTLRLPK